MHLNRIVLVAVLAAALLATGFGCSKSSTALNPIVAPSPSPTPSPTPVVSKGTRLLGLDFLATDASGNFNGNVSFAQGAGVQVMPLHYDWPSAEATTASDCTTAGTYTDPGAPPVLGTFDPLLPADGLKLALTIPVINTNMLRVPSNLAATAFDGVDADTDLLACRFNKFLDWVHSKLPDVQLSSLQIGNELSAYPPGGLNSTALAFWSSYWRFLSEVAPHARSLWPGVPVSVTDSVYGILGTGGNAYSQGGMQQLLTLGDFVSVTYYPENNDFTAKAPSVVATELGAVLSAYPSLPLRILELGYQTGSQYDASSEAQQAAFISAAFHFWDQNATRVPFIAFLRLNDLSLATAVSTAGGYGSSVPAFVEYLQTLGLRNYDGTAKAGFTQFMTETGARGWH